MLETASIASGASIAVFLCVIVCFSLYVHCARRKAKALESECCTDGPRPRRPFDRRPSRPPGEAEMGPEIVLTRITTVRVVHYLYDELMNYNPEKLNLQPFFSLNGRYKEGK